MEWVHGQTRPNISVEKPGFFLGALLVAVENTPVEGLSRVSQNMGDTHIMFTKRILL